MPPAETQTTKPNASQRAFNLTLAAIAGQVGCLTLIIIVAALLGGLWLDNILSTKPLFTIGLVVASMPISLYIMYRVALGAVSRIKPAGPKEE